MELDLQWFLDGSEDAQQRHSLAFHFATSGSSRVNYRVDFPKLRRLKLDCNSDDSPVDVGMALTDCFVGDGAMCETLREFKFFSFKTRGGEMIRNTEEWWRNLLQRVGRVFPNANWM